MRVSATSRFHRNIRRSLLAVLQREIAVLRRSHELRFTPRRKEQKP